MGSAVQPRVHGTRPDPHSRVATSPVCGRAAASPSIAENEIAKNPNRTSPITTFRRFIGQPPSLRCLSPDHRTFNGSLDEPIGRARRTSNAAARPRAAGISSGRGAEGKSRCQRGSALSFRACRKEGVAARPALQRVPSDGSPTRPSDMSAECPGRPTERMESEDKIRPTSPLQPGQVRDQVVGKPAVACYEDLWLRRACVTRDSDAVAERLEGHDLRVGNPQALAGAGEVDVL